MVVDGGAAIGSVGNAARGERESYGTVQLTYRLPEPTKANAPSISIHYKMARKDTPLACHFLLRMHNRKLRRAAIAGRFTQPAVPMHCVALK